MPPRTQILIVDEAGMLRDGLCAFLSREAQFAVAGVIGGTAELATVSLPGPPDIIVVDLGAPGISESRFVESARRRWPDVPILVLTAANDSVSIRSALRAGVDGYILKTEPGTSLLAAIESVLKHERFISPTIVSELLNTAADQTPSPPRATPSDGLSSRELEVMKLIARGMRTREMADCLSVSPKTIDKHRANLMRKLGVRTAAAVAAYAISNGYVVL